MVDVNTICREPRVNRSESGFSEISHTSIKTGEDPKQDEIVEIVKKEPVTSRTHRSFSAVVTTMNDYNLTTLHGLRLIRSALPGKQTVYHFHNNIKKEEQQEKVRKTSFLYNKINFIKITVISFQNALKYVFKIFMNKEIFNTNKGKHFFHLNLIK